MLLSHIVPSSSGELSITFAERLSFQEKVLTLIDSIFEQKSVMSLKDFLHLAKNINSDLVIGVLQVIHQGLPCTPTILRLRDLFIKERSRKNDQMTSYLA